MSPLVTGKLFKAAKVKNLINGEIFIAATFQLLDGSTVEASAPNKLIPGGLFASKVFIRKLPITLIRIPGNHDDPKPSYEIAPWTNQSDIFKSGIIMNILNTTSEAMLENLEWGETNEKLMIENNLKQQLERIFKGGEKEEPKSKDKQQELFIKDEVGFDMDKNDMDDFLNEDEDVTEDDIPF